MESDLDYLQRNFGVPSDAPDEDDDDYDDDDDDYSSEEGWPDEDEVEA